MTTQRMKKNAKFIVSISSSFKPNKAFSSDIVSITKKKIKKKFWWDKIIFKNLLLNGGFLLNIEIVFLSE